MVLTDWTLSASTWSILPALDGTTKYAGNSSLCCTSSILNGEFSRATHNTFSNTQAQIIMWCRTQQEIATVPRVTISTYGALVIDNSADATWERFRVSFWYDSTSNTKWGRVERWSGSAWVQVGGDTNFGTGSPSAGTLVIEAYGIWGNDTTKRNCWFDELEVYI